MKVIFLDIDGVLNTYYTKKEVAGYTFVEDEKVALLQDLVQRTVRRYLFPCINTLFKTAIILIAKNNYMETPEFIELIDYLQQYRVDIRRDL